MIVPSVKVMQILADVTSGVPADQMCQRLVMACADALPVTGVGMVLMTNAGPAGTAAATDGPAATMEDLQFSLGEGPCIEASTSGRPVLLPDLERSGPSRWPGFSAGALEAGIRAIFALPLRVGGVRLGVLDLYRDATGELSPEDLTLALHFADAATAVLLHLQGGVDGNGDGDVSVLEDRAEVHQATGVIAVNAGVDVAQALSLIRAHAFATGQPIIDLAREILAGRSMRAQDFSNELDPT